VEGDWQAHPDGFTPREILPPVEPGRVVGLGAICDLRPRRFDEGYLQRFSVSEFVTLEDGRCVILHEGRGFTTAVRSTGEPGFLDVRLHETRDSIVDGVLNVVLPDDDECAEAHPWSWLADLARARGLDVTAEDLRGLTYEVILTEKVTQWLAGA